MARTTLTFTDYSNENSSVGVTAEDLTAANFAAQETASAALAVAIGALSIGTLVKRVVADIPLDSPATPTNPFAQRELKWHVDYRGATTGKSFSIEIPCANLTADTVSGNTDNADVSDTLWTNFITAFQAYAKSPDDPLEAVEFVGAHVVGRNL